MKKRFSSKPLRFVAILLCALIIALVLEVTLFQPESHKASEFESEELDLMLATDAAGNYLSEYGDPILIQPNESNMFNIVFDELYAETDSVRLYFSGDPVQARVDVALRDDATAYAYRDAYEGYCVPGSEDLSTLDFPLRSNGNLQSLRLTIRLDLSLGAEVWLDAVELNPEPLPVRVEPIRLAVTFLILWFILFLFLYPWRSTAYCPGNHVQRAAFLVSMLLLMALTFSLVGASAPPQMNPWRLIPLEEALTDFTDPYPHLLAAMKHGQLSLLTEPSEDLLALVNPYDISERDAFGVDYLFDYVMYEGQYYVYFGPSPLLLAYLPIYLVTGCVPSQQLCALILTFMSIPLIFFALIGMMRKYGRKVPFFLLWLSCTALAYAAAGPLLFTCASRYMNILIANVAMMAGALGFGFHASIQKKTGLRITQFLLCGLFFGLQAMSRANTIVITTLFLAPAFISVLCEKEASIRSKVRDAACFLVPALIGVGLVMISNTLRFGAPGDFGHSHQLTLEDIRYNTFQPALIFNALFHYLTDIPAFAPPFPYLSSQAAIVNTTGNYFFNGVAVGVFAWPMAWSLFLLVPALRLYRKDSLGLRAQRTAVCVLPPIGAMVLMVVSFFCAGLTQRYNYDFLLCFFLISTFAGLSLAGADEENEGSFLRIWQNVFAFFCMLSLIMAVLFGFRNEHNNILLNNPVFFTRLLRMFFPY